jgi:light-regulated signal transduction histidine kinase (bacteriophytochrome)
VLTNELRRQEVQTWKKVIRVISHELNNSLAPVASLAHSGAELVRRGRLDRLEEVLGTIEERARRLEGFIRGYACLRQIAGAATADGPMDGASVQPATSDRFHAVIGTGRPHRPVVDRTGAAESVEERA